MQRVRSFFAPVGVIGLAHVVGGVAALVAPQAAQVSGLAGMTMMGSPAPFTSFILVTVGAMAVGSRFCPANQDATRALVAPQQLLLTVQLAGVIVAIYQGAYPDGYRPTDEWWSSMWFILADQSPLIAMCMAHTIEVAVGGLVNEEREFYQKELKDVQEALETCNRCWSMQKEFAFWRELADGRGPSAGPNIERGNK
jgi:hypothetical protein